MSISKDLGATFEPGVCSAAPARANGGLGPSSSTGASKRMTKGSKRGDVAVAPLHRHRHLLPALHHTNMPHILKFISVFVHSLLSVHTCVSSTCDAQHLFEHLRCSFVLAFAKLMSSIICDAHLFEHLRCSTVFERFR